MLLNISNLSVCYDRHKVLDGVSMSADSGERIAIIGPNGAGKSTLLKTIAGIIKSVSGEMLFEGRSIARLEPTELIDAAIVFVPQDKRVFPRLTVMDNIEVMLGKLDKRERRTLTDSVMSLFPIIGQRKNVLAGRLSGGEQQIVALARALTLKPRLLLLDEPSHGLSSAWADLIFEKLAELQKAGITVILVEQNVRKALSFATRAYVLKMGRVIREGNAVELLSNLNQDWGFSPATPGSSN